MVSQHSSWFSGYYQLSDLSSMRFPESLVKDLYCMCVSTGSMLPIIFWSLHCAQLSFCDVVHMLCDEASIMRTESYTYLCYKDNVVEYKNYISFPEYCSLFYKLNLNLKKVLHTENLNTCLNSVLMFRETNYPQSTNNWDWRLSTVFKGKIKKPQGKKRLSLRCRSDFVSNIRLKVTAMSAVIVGFFFLFEIESSYLDCLEQRLFNPGEKM